MTKSEVRRTLGGMLLQPLCLSRVRRLPLAIHSRPPQRLHGPPQAACHLVSYASTQGGSPLCTPLLRRRSHTSCAARVRNPGTQQVPMHCTVTCFKPVCPHAHTPAPHYGHVPCTASVHTDCKDMLAPRQPPLHGGEPPCVEAYDTRWQAA